MMPLYLLIGSGGTAAAAADEFACGGCLKEDKINKRYLTISICPHKFLNFLNTLKNFAFSFSFPSCNFDHAFKTGERMRERGEFSNYIAAFI